MGQSVIYVLKCPRTGEVRYVGKTATELRERLRCHLVDARNGKSEKCNWIRSLVTSGLWPIIEVDAVIPDGADWKAIEIERIAFYKAKGCKLTNETDGGDDPGQWMTLRAPRRRYAAARSGGR
jgi:hypothetical protein